MVAARLSTGKSMLVYAAVTAMACLAALALLAGQHGGGVAGHARSVLLEFPEYKNMCLAACKYGHAKDVKAKLAIMAKCEPNALSRSNFIY